MSSPRQLFGSTGDPKLFFLHGTSVGAKRRKEGGKLGRTKTKYAEKPTYTLRQSLLPMAFRFAFILVVARLKTQMLITHHARLSCRSCVAFDMSHCRAFRNCVALAASTVLGGNRRTISFAIAASACARDMGGGGGAPHGTMAPGGGPMEPGGGGPCGDPGGNAPHCCCGGGGGGGC